MKQQKETQGWCEGVCGLYDHYLIDGLCAQCRKKFVDFEGEHASDDNYAERAMEDVTQEAYREMLGVEVAA